MRPHGRRSSRQRAGGILGSRFGVVGSESGWAGLLMSHHDSVRLTTELRKEPSVRSQLMGHADGSLLARVHGHLDKNVAFLKQALAD